MTLLLTSSTSAGLIEFQGLTEGFLAGSCIFRLENGSLKLKLSLCIDSIRILLCCMTPSMLSCRRGPAYTNMIYLYGSPSVNVAVPAKTSAWSLCPGKTSHKSMVQPIYQVGRLLAATLYEEATLDKTLSTRHCTCMSMELWLASPFLHWHDDGGRDIFWIVLTSKKWCQDHCPKFCK